MAFGRCGLSGVFWDDGPRCCVHLWSCLSSSERFWSGPKVRGGRVRAIRIRSGSSTSVAWSSENVFFELRSTLTAGRDPLTDRPFDRE